MKILLIDRYFHPDLQATSILLTDLAQNLAQDNKVHVLCGPASTFREAQNPIAKQIKIHVVPSTEFDQRSIWGRLFNYASFLAMIPFAILFHPKVDVALIGTSPP